MHVRIIGAGWTGLSAAVTAIAQGWQVTLIEASQQAGGRARRIPSPSPAASPQTAADSPHALDNGQHILIGAYQETLGLMRTVGVDMSSVLLRQPLDMRDHLGQGLSLPHLPAPWDVLIGIATADGWPWRDKLSLLRAASRWQWQGYRCPAAWTVQQLCEAHGLTQNVQRGLIEPLCLSALNTALHEASASVFLRVLHDALFSGAGSADFLLPRQDLSKLLPEPAIAWLAQRGAHLRFGEAIDATALQTMMQRAPPQKSIEAPIVLATSFRQAAKLTRAIAPAWSQQAQALSPRAIATVYLRVHEATYRGLPRPIMALNGTPAQFVFCRAQLLGHAGVIAAVASDCQLERDALTTEVVDQVRAQLGFKNIEVLQTVVEKQATFACTPDLARPPAAIDTTTPNTLWACGDYVEGPYPATLEGAVRSGLQVIAQIREMHKA
jgi:squalene-associated FAD-dependent desaturase